MTVAELIEALRHERQDQRVLVLEPGNDDYHLRALGQIRRIRGDDRWDGFGGAVLLELDVDQ